MRIFKVLNNNVAVILNEEGQEQIVMGRGICFKKKAGEEIPDEMIDKEFHLSTPEAHNKFRELIQDIPMEHISLGEEIIAEAKAIGYHYMLLDTLPQLENALRLYKSCRKKTCQASPAG